MPHGDLRMRSLSKCIPGMVLFAAVAWPQAVTPNPAKDLLENGKQLYTQEGPKAALPKFEEALKFFRSNGDRRNEAISLGYIANCHRKLGNLDLALGFAQQALHMKQDLGDRGEIGKTHNQLGLIYWERSDYPNAIHHLNASIEIASAVEDKELRDLLAITWA